MTLPEPTPYVSAWSRLTGKPRAATAADPLTSRGKLWLYGICAAIVIASWIGIANSNTPPATGPGYYSITQSDALYLNQLTQTGVPYGNAAIAISVGKDVGHLYDQGYTTEQLVAQYQTADAQLDTAYTPQQMRQLVYAGIQHYATRR